VEHVVRWCSVLGSGIGLSVMSALDGCSLYTVNYCQHNLTLHHIVVYDGQ